jgi:PhnB protein
MTGPQSGLIPATAVLWLLNSAQNVTRVHHFESWPLNTVKTQRPGWHTVTPRIIVAEPEPLLVFLKETFGAQGEFQPRLPTEMKIGDSVIMISDGGGQRTAMNSYLYVYVEDVDSTYRRALSAKAISIEAPAEMPYGDRRATVKDPWGNVWQIASYSSADR